MCPGIRSPKPPASMRSRGGLAARRAGAGKCPPDLPSQALLPFSWACYGLLSFPSFMSKETPSKTTNHQGILYFSDAITWLLGSACGLQSHTMSPRENHFRHTRPGRSSTSRRRLILEPTLEAVRESLWNFLPSDTPWMDLFRSILFSRPFSVATWL